MYKSLAKRLFDGLIKIKIFPEKPGMNLINGVEPFTQHEKCKQVPLIGISALTYCCFPDSETKYLLVLRDQEPGRNRWSFPGGKLCWKESITDGALRELYEEVGFSKSDVLSIHHLALATENITQSSHFLIATVPVEIESRRSLCFRVGQDAKAAMWCTKKEINHMQKENQIVGRLQELIETFSSLSWDKKK